jgi:hypothetical protein
MAARFEFAGPRRCADGRGLAQDRARAVRVGGRLLADRESVEAHDGAAPPLAGGRAPLEGKGWNMHDGDHATLHEACAYVDSLTSTATAGRNERAGPEP